MALAIPKIVLCVLAIAVSLKAEDVPANLSTDELVAWCIVPFDAKKRNPGQRAEMLKRIGVMRSAYDWRSEHVAEFEEEIIQYQKHGIEFFAFWKGHETAFLLFEKYNIRPQIWHTLISPKSGSQDQKVIEAATIMQALAKRTGEAGCKLGLYNHGNWGGEPQNLIAVCEKLRAMGHDHVGIVYNWHHGHGHIKDWPEVLESMLPYLHCLNLNGMNPGGDPKIQTLGQGEHEQVMLRAVIKSGYQGPIGILDHRNELDTEKALLENLSGLKQILKP